MGVRITGTMSSRRRPMREIWWADKDSAARRPTTTSLSLSRMRLRVLAAAPAFAIVELSPALRDC